MKQVVCLLALCVTALLSVWLVTESQKKSGVIEAIEARRSVRAYKDTPVEREKLQLLAECGVLAPSAMNRQEWEVRLVDSKEWIDGCSAAYLKAVEGTDKANYLLKPGFKNIFRNATALIFVAAPEGAFSGENIGFLGQNIMLATPWLLVIPTSRPRQNLAINRRFSGWSRGQSSECRILTKTECVPGEYTLFN